MPLKSKFRDWQLDNDSCCYFCQVGYETTFHLFGTCEKLKGLWVILRNVHLSISQADFDYEYNRQNFRIDLTNALCNQNFEKTHVYLNTIANYSIWRHRNDMRYNFESFNLRAITSKMICSIGARRHVDTKMSESHRIPYINQLYEVLVRVVNQFPFDNG